MSYFVPGLAYPQQQWDTSSIGGICRTKCHQQGNPSACCQAKSGLPNCKDADCAGAFFTGTTPFLSPPPAYNPGYYNPGYYTPGYQVPSYQGYQFPQLTPSPGYQYYSGGYSNGYMQQPTGQFGGAHSYYGSQMYPGAIAQMPAGNDCKAWPTCNAHPDPHGCCRAKPGTCYDPDCIAGQYSGKLQNLNSGYLNIPYAPPTGPVGPRDCMGAPSCLTHPMPGACCASKLNGCDPACAPGGVLNVTYDGSTFNNENASTDLLYGVDRNYAGDQ